MEKHIYKFEKQKNHYCSHNCYLKWQKENGHLRSNKVTVSCAFCGEDVTRKPSEIQNKENIFCNTKCYAEWQKENKTGENSSNWQGGPVEKTCLTCGEIYHVKKSHADTSQFCSDICRTQGVKNRTTIMHSNCAYCGKEIIRPEYEMSRHEHNFCDLKCVGKWNGIQRDNKVTKICKVCGKEYKTKKCYENTSSTCSPECRMNFKSDTYPERLTEEYFKLHNIEYMKQYPVDKLFADFYIPDKNLLIEVQGDYWHSNPAKFGGDTGIPLNHIQLNGIKRDKVKKQVYKRLGYNSAFIWETDIYNNLNEVMANALQTC